MDNVTYEYTTFPRQFLAYKWFKPLLVGLLTVVFSVVVQAVFWGMGILMLGGDTTMVKPATDRSSAPFYEGPGVLMALGGVAGMLIALALAVLIVRDRPFSSYSSSRGGFNWGAYFKYLVVSLIFFGAALGLCTVFFPDGTADGVNKFSIVGVAIFAVLVFFQGAAEEYIYRGLIMQTFASWTKLPAVGIVVSSVVFAVSHSYDLLGILAVLVDGFALAIIAWYTKGLEASCAAHGVHNFLVIGMSGLGLTDAGSGGLESLVQVIIMQIVFVAIVILIEKKFNWCKSKGDGVSAYNDKYRAKMAAKQQG